MLLATIVLVTSFAHPSSMSHSILRPVNGPLMSEPQMNMMGRRDIFLGVAAAATASLAPGAAVAGPREDGIKLLRKQAENAKKAPAPGSPRDPTRSLVNGPPGNAKKCTVSKACATGAGLGWDPVALGVAGGATKPDGSNPRKFFKTPTYANQKEAS